jgi:DNA mismatch endonuclease (patch repair protein)
MSSIQGRDTRPELALRSALRSLGITGYRYHANVVGRPDIAFTRWRLAVFVDGVWWHGRPDYLPRGRRGAYWDEKIAGNCRRDNRVNEELRESGWTVVRMWDLDVMADPVASAKNVLANLRSRGWPGAHQPRPLRRAVARNSKPFARR